MKSFPVLALVLLLAGACAQQAEARQSSRALTCQGALRMVREMGAVLFDTGPTTFDRYVRDGSFCPLATVLRPAWIATRDNANCNVGYICAPEVPRDPIGRF